MRYELKGTEYQCTRITDRNGNYITINYTTTGRIVIDDIVDTLGRSIDFVYDANGWLTHIKQLWNAGAATQYWARFEYTDTTIDTNFPSMAVYGPADTTQIKTLSKVVLPDNSYHQFSYTSWGQVWKISRYGSDNQPINYRSYDLPQTGATAHSDCPRFTARKDWAKYWNGDTDGTTAGGEEVSTNYIVPVSNSWTMPDGSSQSGTRAQITTPDGTSTKIYFIGANGYRLQVGDVVCLHSLWYTYDNAGILQRQDNDDLDAGQHFAFLSTQPARYRNQRLRSGRQSRAHADFLPTVLTFSNGTSCHLPIDVI